MRSANAASIPGPLGARRDDLLDWRRETEFDHPPVCRRVAKVHSPSRHSAYVCIFLCVVRSYRLMANLNQKTAAGGILFMGSRLEALANGQFDELRFAVGFDCGALLARHRPRQR